MQHAALPCSYTTRRARDGEQLFCAQFLLFHSKYAPITRGRKSILFGTFLVLAGHAMNLNFSEERGAPSFYYVLSASTIGLHLAAQKSRARPSRESSRPPARPALLC